LRSSRVPHRPGGPTRLEMKPYAGRCPGEWRSPPSKAPGVQIERRDKPRQAVATRTNATTPATSRRCSKAGLPKASKQPISKRRRCYSTSSTERLGTQCSECQYPQRSRQWCRRQPHPQPSATSSAAANVNRGLGPGSPYNIRSQYVLRNDCSASTRVSSSSCAPEDRPTATVKRTCGIPARSGRSSSTVAIALKWMLRGRR
jgi:hypothetical protein